MSYLLAHDLGTSGDKATLYSLEGAFVAEHSEGYHSSYPFPRAAEQDARDWWRAFCLSTRALIEQQGIRGSDITAVSFSAQMNACLPVDGAGQPLRPAMIWADQRASAEAERLIRALGREALYRRTAQPLSASHGICKMAWLKDNEPDIYGKTAKFLQAKDYVACCLTGGMHSDPSDASHLGCYDLHDLRWLPEVLREAGIAEEKLPELLPSTAVAGHVTGQAAQASGLLEGTPVVVGGGDGPCATAGAGIYAPGQAYVSLGTSAWMAMLSERPVCDERMMGFGLMHLDGRHRMTLGAVQSAGLSLEWALGLFYSQAEMDAAYRQLETCTAGVPAGSGGLFFLPYLLGERSPWWNPHATGCFTGLTPRHGKAEILRAVMEGVGYNLRIILEMLRQHRPFERLKMVGGGARNACWLKALADVWQMPLDVARVLSGASSTGAALCAAIGIGAIPDFSIGARVNPAVREILPDRRLAPLYEDGLRRFKALYQALEPVAFAPADQGEN